MIRRAFTIVELLVVTIIIALLALIAIPAFNAIIADSERSLAEESLQTAIRTARAAALKSAGADDVALVFQYIRTPDGGKTTMVVCRRAGLLEDLEGGFIITGIIPREVFVPVPDVDPIQLPKDWMVRGYARVGTISNRQRGWYEGGRYDPGMGNWVFPETDFYDVEVDQDGEDRQTFAIRFEAGSGIMTMTPSNEILVLSTRPSQAGRSTAAADQYLRVDDAENDLRVVRAILNQADILDRVALLGARSGDTILARPVSQIALYNERELAAALDVRVDRDTGCLYQDDTDPRFVAGGVDQAQVNAWIEGDTNFDQRFTLTDDNADVPLARVYTIDRHTAFLMPLEVP